ncbi:MAG: carbon-nitrogen hydrolase family protein [Eubacteriales bacterium]|nr:carbon-nitrogen hydrolase family protein [Eubacteriales bacterium]
MKVNVTCVQMEPVLRGFHKNLEKMCVLIELTMCENPQTDLIVFPELITTGYECSKDFQSLAETVPDGLSMRIIGALAKEYRVHIVYGFAERDGDQEDMLYNSAVFIDDAGQIKGVYRKVHLTAKEKDYFKAGGTYPVFDSSLGKIGIMICWDAVFPEVARSLALKGADLLIVPANWQKTYLTSVETKNQKDWDLVMRARAMDNCIYLVSANRIGLDQTIGFFGRSNIIGPTGDVIAERLEEEEGLISAELEYSLPAQLRTEYYTFFEDRRPDTYLELTKNY